MKNFILGMFVAGFIHRYFDEAVRTVVLNVWNKLEQDTRPTESKWAGDKVEKDTRPTES